MTLEELGERIGLGLNSVNKIELGNRKATIGEAVAIAAALDVPLAMLVEDAPLVVPVRL